MMEQQSNAKKLLRQLRIRQIEMLTKNAWPNEFQTFYKEVVSMVESGQLQRLNVYALLSDLFEDCPEESLEQFFTIFQEIQPQVPLPPEHLHHCTKVVRMITSKLTVTHDLKFRGTLQRFLTQIMPLTHPTGVNLLGKFNDTNTTGISSQKEVRESQNSAVSDDYTGFSQGEEKIRSSSQQQFSVGEFKAYRNFWSLQKYLNNPFLIFKAERGLDFEELNTEIESNISNKQSKECDDNKSEQSFAEGSSPIVKAVESEIPATVQKVAQETFKSSLLHVIAIINKFLERFKSQPLNPQSSNAQIQDKYPKYLSKFSLLNLQLNDATFRVTFLTQVTIFLQTILTPLTTSADQVRYFKLKDDEINLVKDLIKEVSELIERNSESTNTNCLKQQIFENEPQWLKWKANKCANYELQPDAAILQKLQARRQAKFDSKLPKLKPLVQAKEMNSHRGAKKIHQCLRAPGSKELESQPSLSKFLVPVFIDLDPDQGVEDEYKNKTNQLFSWRLLRSIAENDLKNFAGDGQQPQTGKDNASKSKTQFKFEGNIESQAQIFLGLTKKE